MGQIRIEMYGSFPRCEKTFSAIQHGHAAAIAEAIAWLSQECMPDAIFKDHLLHSEGAKPEAGFGR